MSRSRAPAGAALRILVPVLRRPHRVRPLLRSIEAATPDARVLFLTDTNDERECAAIRRERKSSALRVDAVACGGNWAHKINEGATRTNEPLLFLGADDLEFHPGWLEAAMRKMRGRVQVVGVNDLIDRKRQHSTHFLVSRDYLERGTIDEPGKLIHEGYSHWYCDDEFLGTARRRHAYTLAPDAVVEHLHPLADKAPDDAVYRKGRAHAKQDARLYRKRRRLWRRSGD